MIANRTTLQKIRDDAVVSVRASSLAHTIRTGRSTNATNEKAAMNQKAIRSAIVTTSTQERNGIGVGALLVAVQRARQAETGVDRHLVVLAMQKRLKRESLIQTFEMMAFDKKSQMTQDRAEQQLRSHMQLE